MSNTWIVDLRHYLDASGALADMPPRARPGTTRYIRDGVEPLR